MTRLIVAIIVVMLATVAAGAELRVVDGDTFRAGSVVVRIENIDAPETHEARCAAERRLGLRATERLRELLASGRIALSRNPEDPRDHDRYGRKLRRVAVDGEDVGGILVREGLARAWDGRRHPWC